MLKKILETAFDVQFSVKKQGDVFYIHPTNEMDELFEVCIQFRNQVRIIVEIAPQTHAADMLRDIGMATDDKKTLFFNYLDEFRAKGAHTSVRVNNEPTDLSSWPTAFKTFKITISKVEERDFSLEEIACEWAPIAVGAMLSLLNVEAIESESGHLEGKRYQILETKYERNPANRELCLSAHGYNCKICGMNFEKAYGLIGRNFINVHHIEMVSQMAGPRVIDPRKDLIPVCPNCHAMLHSQTPPLLPEQLIQTLKEHHCFEHQKEQK